jgi:hypothetical protein
LVIPRWLWPAAGVLLLATAASARHSGEYLSDVSTKLETPHTDWAQPYVGGKLRVLFIMPQILAPREIVELWQRMPLDFQAVLTEHAGSFAATDMYAAQVEGTSPSEKAAELRRKLQQPYDAIVLGNVQLDILPLEFQYELLRRVSQGTGLLMAYDRPYKHPLTSKPFDTDRDFITSAVPWRGLPYFQGEVQKTLGARDMADLPDRAVRTYRLGQGRLAILDYGELHSGYYGGTALTPNVPASLDFTVEYDYYLSLVMRALLWVCPDHLPRVRVTLPPDGRSLSRADLARLMPVQADNRSGAPLPVEVWTRFRDTRGNDSCNTQQQTLAAGANQFPVRAPSLPSGQWFFDVIVRSAQGVETWGSTSFLVTTPVDLASFAAVKESVERDQSAELQATLSAPAPKATSLRVDLVDTQNRLFARAVQPVSTGATSATVKLPVARALTIAVRARASLAIGGRLVARREALLYVPRRSSEELTSVLWGTNDEGLWMGQWDLMRQAGFNCFLNHPSPDNFQRTALADYRPFVYAYRICGGADEKGWRKSGFGPSVGDDSFSNPAWRDAAKAELQQRIAPCPPVGPAVYSLGDENELDYNSGFSPSDETGFRRWLQEQYPGLDDLNRSWGTTFASWDEVKPMNRAEAAKAGEFARIHDHLAFLEWQYAEIHHAMRDWIRELDPKAAVGAEGSVPGDLELSLGDLEMWSPYAWPRTDVLQMSLVRPEVIYGNWWGGYVGSHGGRQPTPILWEHLLRGLNTSLWYAVTGSEGLLQAGGGFAPYFERELPQFQEIHAGLGQQIVASRPTDDGLYLHWSQAAEHAATWNTSFGTPEASQTALIVAAREIGLNPRYVTTRGLEQRQELASRKPKVVFVLGSRPVSDAEAAAFRSYVEAGGNVVIEARSGLLDGHCKPRAANVLQELLGVQSDVAAQPAKAQLQIQAKLSGQDLRLQSGEVRIDPTVRAATAQVLVASGDLPLLTVNRVGKGQAILLNFPLSDALAGAVPASQGVDFAGALLGACGVRPRAWVEPRGGWEVRYFDNGDLPLVGLLRRQPGAATLLLRQPAHVVDARAGKYLGRVERLPLPAGEPRDVLIYTLLPARPGPLGLSVRGAPVGQDAAVTLRLGGDLKATRIVRVRVTDPGGAERRAYRRYLRARQASVEFSIPLAYGDPAGQWTLKATDIATGATATARFRVRAGG